MAAKLIRSTDAIDVSHLGCVLYGEPGSRKTSLAQTAAEPFTFAFDPGIYRAYGRRDCAMFDCWGDVTQLCAEADSGKDGELARMAANAKTLVLDTLGMGMQSLANALIQENPKNGNRMGGLSLPGYGALATQFGAWIASRLGRGQDVVMICHEDSDKRGDELYHFPAIIGAKFYSELMRFADVVGYLHFANGKRVIDFAPSDRWMAKTPPCDWGTLTLPDFAKEPDFLARLLGEAKSSMGRLSAESAEMAKVVDQWQANVAACETLEHVNLLLGSKGLKELTNGTKSQVWHVITKRAESLGLAFDGKAKKFTAAKEAA